MQTNLSKQNNYISHLKQRKTSLPTNKRYTVLKTFDLDSITSRSPTRLIKKSNDKLDQVRELLIQRMKNVLRRIFQAKINTSKD
jgi:hypothetical protein